MINLYSKIVLEKQEQEDPWAESLGIAERAVRNGITTFVNAPPFVIRGNGNSTGLTVEDREELHGLLEEKNMKLTVLPGHCIRSRKRITDEEKEQQLLTVNGTSYVYVDLSGFSSAVFAKTLLDRLQKEGYHTVLIFPEFAPMFINNPGFLHYFVNRGAISMLSAESILRIHGKDTQQLAMKFLQGNLAHVLSSSPRSALEPFRLKQAYDHIDLEFGTDWTEFLQTNTGQIIEDMPVVVYDPLPMPQKGKKLFPWGKG